MSPENELGIVQEQQNQNEENEQENNSEQIPSEGSSEGESKKEIAESQKEMKNFIKELKLKVGGKEISKKIDVNDDAALIREFQIAESNKLGMQKAAEYEKSFQQFISNLQNDPKGVLKQLGQDPDKMLESWVEEKLKEMEKSPEDKAREDAIKKAEDAEKKAKDLEDKLSQREFMEMKRQQTDIFERQFGDFFNKYPNAPEEFRDEIRNKAVMTMQKYLEEIPELELKDVLPIVEQQYFERFNKMVEASPLALIEKMFGKKTIDKLRLENVKKIQESQVNNLTKGNTSVVQPNISKTKSSEQLINSKDFFRNLGRK